MNLLDLAVHSIAYLGVGVVVLAGPVSVVVAVRDARQHPYLPALPAVEPLELMERAA